MTEQWYTLWAAGRCGVYVSDERVKKQN